MLEKQESWGLCGMTQVALWMSFCHSCKAVSPSPPWELSAGQLAGHGKSLVLPPSLVGGWGFPSVCIPQYHQNVLKVLGIWNHRDIGREGNLRAASQLDAHGAILQWRDPLLPGGDTCSGEPRARVTAVLRAPAELPRSSPDTPIGLPSGLGGRHPHP